jgi:glycosyltransferase involved in cell wall biosynthesis
MAPDQLTIVIPTYGTRGGLLERAISSALPLPVVVVDDATPDKSVKVLAHRLGTCYVRRDRNGGVAAAQNSGAAAVSTEWVQFLHSDDVLASATADFRPPQRCDVVQGLQRVGDHLVAPALGKPESDFFWLRFGVYIGQYRFRTELVRSVGFDESLRGNEDWDLLLRLNRLGLRIVDTDEVLGITHLEAGDRLSNSRLTLDSLIYLYGKYANELSEDRGAKAAWAFEVAQLNVIQGDRCRDSISWLCRSLLISPLHPRRVAAVAALIKAQRRQDRAAGQGARSTKT